LQYSENKNLNLQMFRSANVQNRKFPGALANWHIGKFAYS